jgi:hypothetical protein
VKSKKITFGQKKKYMSGGIEEMKAVAKLEFSVTLVNGETFTIKKGDTFNVATTYISFPSQSNLVVLHKKHTAPFACLLKNFDIVES